MTARKRSAFLALGILAGAATAVAARPFPAAPPCRTVQAGPAALRASENTGAGGQEPGRWSGPVNGYASAEDSTIYTARNCAQAHK